MPLEIERKYLLRGVPSLPAHASAERLEQGYLDDGGRVRRAVAADGTVRCTHTVKHGRGLVRQEVEQVIDEGEFERLWKRTGGRRLRKTRHTVAHDRLRWEIDVYDDLDLAIAEVELPTADHVVAPPAWLAGHVVRDVTDEMGFSNLEIAGRLAGS